MFLKHIGKVCSLVSPAPHLPTKDQTTFSIFFGNGLHKGPSSMPLKNQHGSPVLVKPLLGKMAWCTLHYFMRNRMHHDSKTEATETRKVEVHVRMGMEGPSTSCFSSSWLRREGSSNILFTFLWAQFLYIKLVKTVFYC